MEPVTSSIVAALVAGAVATARDVASSAVKDAYNGLKRLIVDQYENSGQVLESIEATPQDENAGQKLVQLLEAKVIAKDDDISKMAQSLLEAIDALRHDEAATPLFEFDRLKIARNLELSDFDVLGPVFRGNIVEVKGDFKVQGFRQSLSSKKKPRSSQKKSP